MAGVTATPKTWMALDDRQRVDEEFHHRTVLAAADAMAKIVDIQLDRIAELYRERLEDRRANAAS